MKKEEALEMAKKFVEDERAAMIISNSTPAVINYKGRKHIGSIQKIYPKDEEIVLCAHSSFPVEDIFVEAIKEVSPERLDLVVDDEIELAHRQDVLRMVDGKLEKLTPEQTTIAAQLLRNHDIVEFTL